MDRFNDQIVFILSNNFFLFIPDLLDCEDRCLEFLEKLSLLFRKDFLDNTGGLQFGLNVFEVEEVDEWVGASDCSA